MILEHKTIREVAGPLMLVDGISGVKYGELGTITLEDGSRRRCKVLELDGDKALLQLFESSAGINLAHSTVSFSGHGISLGVSPDILGRVFSGMGDVIDGGPRIIADETLDINGTPINPAARS